MGMLEKGAQASALTPPGLAGRSGRDISRLPFQAMERSKESV